MDATDTMLREPVVTHDMPLAAHGALQPSPDLGGARNANAASPLSVSFMIAAMDILFLMLRRPLAVPTTPAGVPVRSGPAAVGHTPLRPTAAPTPLRPPGEVEPASAEDEFEWITIGA